jgi:hypothetical protein
MKITIDLPDDLRKRLEALAKERKTTLDEIIIHRLNGILPAVKDPEAKRSALDRLHRGLHLGGKPLSREEVYQRR